MRETNACFVQLKLGSFPSSLLFELNKPCVISSLRLFKFNKTMKPMKWNVGRSERSERTRASFHYACFVHSSLSFSLHYLSLLFIQLNLQDLWRAFRSISFFLFTFLQINEVHAWKRWKKRTKGTHGSFTSFLCHFFSFCFFHTVHASFSSLRSFIHYNRVEAKKEKWKEKDMKWIPCL